MIGICIAMGVWTSGLLYMSMKSEKRRIAAVLDTQEASSEATAVVETNEEIGKS